MTKIQILFHGNCFDGCCSSALFSRLFRHITEGEVSFSYTPCYHVKGVDLRDQLDDEATTAVVDFDFVGGADWWFDHHKSGLKAEDQVLYEAQKGERYFYDPKRGSCTKFIADIARDRFGVEFPELSDLVTWAEKCDFAQFADAAEATDLTHPAKVIEAVVGATKNRDLLVTVIERLQTETLAAVAALPEIQAEFGPLRERHQAFFDLFHDQGQSTGGVYFADFMTPGDDIDGYNKFIPYSLFPDTDNSVLLAAKKGAPKIYLGRNPWGPGRNQADLAALAEEFGGGGHPRAAGVSLSAGEEEKAVRIYREIVERLRG